jgi:hypothetical protein
MRREIQVSVELLDGGCRLLTIQRTPRKLYPENLCRLLARKTPARLRTERDKWISR